MHRPLHPALARPTARLLAAVVVLVSWSCGRTIEEEAPRELVEHRIEPCRKWCSAQHSPECGAEPGTMAFDTAEECLQDCAAVEPEYGWEWARQADGTDACAEEWTAAAECMDALTCEEQRAFFRRPGTSDEYACKAELDATRRCADAARSARSDD